MKTNTILPILLEVLDYEPNICQYTIITLNIYNKEKNTNNIIISKLFSNPDNGMLTDHLTNLILREKLMKFRRIQGQKVPVHVQFQRLYKTSFQDWLARENKEYKSTFYEFNYLPVISKRGHKDKESKIQDVQALVKEYDFQNIEEYQQIKTRIVVHPKIYPLNDNFFYNQEKQRLIELIYTFRHLPG